MNWVKNYVQSLPEPEIPNDIKAIEIDEMWHFLHLKKTNYGCLKPSIEKAEKLLRGLQENEILKRSNAYFPS
jgi:transposase